MAAAKKSARKKASKKRPAAEPKRLKRAIGTTPPPPPPPPGRHRPLRPGLIDFYVVGIGASAGGLEAFEQFFQHMPSDSGMAFVLIPHLSPEHKSMMGELLKRYTAMEIQEAREGMEVKPNHIYIIPPNKDLAVANNLLLLQEPAKQRGIRHPIDYFFRSLAQDQGDRAICVILSGTGTEGTIGLRAVKGEGGLVLAQDPKDAKYDSMPASAITTGLVDHVLPAAKMPDLLLRYTKVTAGKLVRSLVRAEERPVEALQKIYTLIRAKTGHDFTLYKQNTVMRRVRKRMALHQIEALDEYVVYLKSNPHEIDILFNELLIRVTSFFRDADAFESLASTALPQILGDKHDDSAVRIWVPGCSTGEEAYSLAILCHEYQQEHKGPHRKVQIFATDIDTGAIEIGRAGVYPESIAVDVSPDRLNRYFTKRSGAYKIKDEIREMVVIAVQDLIKDPPFSKLDLAACRNVLIYMGASLQKRVLALLHYALKPGGVLFLGSSETVGDASNMFSVVDRKWKIFRARRVEMLPVEAIELRRPVAPVEGGTPGAPAALRLPATNIGDFTERLLLERYSPPCCVVNDKGDILFIHGKTGRYLEPAAGKASLNIIEMAREGMRLEMRTGLRKAVTHKKDVLYEGLQVKSNGGYKAVNLEIRYINKPEHLEGLMMVVFHEAPAAIAKVSRAGTLSRQKVNEKFSAMEYELKSTREHLQSTIEELETSNEELKSTNEELQSSNEELQSTNEEVETSREELQSMNEELLTVNTELQHKMEELSDANSDIVNLLTSTQIATLFLTYDLRIRRFTPSAVDVINIIQSDIGRPIGDISMKVNYPELMADAEEVLRDLSQKERSVQQQDGRWFLVRIVPYRTLDNVIDGVILTFVDITQQKKSQQIETALAASLQGIVDTVQHPLLVLDRDLFVVSANRAYYKMFKTSSEGTLNRLIFDLGDGGWSIPALKKLIDETLSSNTPVENYSIEHDFPGTGRRKILLNARRIFQEGLKTDTILLAMEDVTNK